MQFKDALLALVTYPDPTPTTAINDVVGIAAALGAHMTAMAFQIEFQGPTPTHFLANRVVDMPAFIAGERKTTSDNADALITAFKHAATLRNLPNDYIRHGAELSAVGGSLVERARLRDVTIIVVPDPGFAERQLAEAVIFGAGRPVIVVPGAARGVSPASLDNVVVAWDGSRAAARALFDALPILERAKLVRVVAVANEKSMPASSGDEIARHLARHDVEIGFEVLDAGGKPIANVLESYVASHGADLLVMGAFGHSRLRDFVLGGATRGMLDRRPIPLFLSY